MLTDEEKLEFLYFRREEMELDLITNRKFTKKGAANAVDVFLKTMRFVLWSTGSLPLSERQR